ncbi:MAG: hypothetical protein MRY74_12245 [Neomegalonema sp.]|nr:hypothetical protein [Neomegalonema sp.]
MMEMQNGLKRFELMGDLSRFDDWMARNGNPDFHQAVINELTSEPRLNTQPYPDVDLFRSKTVKSLTHGGRCFVICFVIDDAYDKVTIVYARSYSSSDKALKHFTSASLRGFAERLVETVLSTPFI